MKDIAEWLASIGLGEYAQRFAENRIDASVLRDLTDQDLEKIGIPLGHRKKMLRAIAELGGAVLTTPQAVTGPNRQDTAERRHLTVMICDLVGSTALSARLDPEDMRAVIDAYHAACARITRTYDGFLAEFRGDGILAYFGYPLAHEDDAERTVRAGLDIIAAVARLETRAAEPLAVRIGIATGVVVIGDLSREGALRKHAVVGETPRYAPLALSPTQQRRRTLAALLDQFEGLARQQPILLLFEDAHWADATSLELLDLTVERMRQLPVLALFTFRPEFEPPWVGLPNVGTLTLGRLDHNDVESMVAQVTGGRVLPAEVLKQIVAKTDGNPLFVEELTKAVLEAGILVEDAKGYRLDGPLPPFAIPATLQDSLMARLDRRAPVREIAQIGAAIGREFSYSLVHALVGRDETALKYALAQLEQAELVFRRGEPPEAVYSFKHALVRDAAYESLLKSRRHQLHGQIARALEERFPDVVASEPEIVARHFTEAGLIEPAINYWLKAGNLALGRSANAEAVKHLRQGIELTQSLAPSPERVRKELDFYLALGPAVAATEGDAAPETSRVFSHARDLLGGGGTLAEQMTVLWGAYLAHSMRAEHTAALEVARQCLALAAHHEHPGISALANRFMGQTLHFMGALVDARVHLERTLDLCAANQEAIAAYRRFGTDDQSNALSFLAPTLLLLGYPEQCVAAAGQAVSRAQATGHAYSTALALSHVAFLGTVGCDPERAAAYADEAIALSVEHGLTSPDHRARFFRGALLAQNGDPQRGIELMRNAIAAAEGNAERNRRTLYLCHLASAHASLGQPEVSLDLLDEAIQTAEITSERFFEAELYRLRGEMLLTLGKKGEAEAGLQRALTIAQQQQARWWELRAATSLAKHWHEEGRYVEACSLLQPVYGWFVEGFDTTDLKDAKALLDELRDLSGPQNQARRG
jgi:tetratricopeptide (TPR) repeat protein